ncbi:MAG: CRISPR-associated protein Cas2 [Thermoanaerobacter sp.]|jgi:CRISPR-associated protein Cas2|nr:CRISPR-associated protein Cas2 [Thermoanaerobacter sp.]MDK2793207.1 CRISPR-associated protein Cas2 [Deferribacteres bacterium]
MYVIVVYDVSTINENGQKRLSKIMKLLRQYLHHTQKSVFEGEISQGKVYEIEKKIEGLIDKDADYVVLYKIDNKKNINRTTIGIEYDASDKFL